ncbi:O-antigen ligase family protein [Microbacterium sp. NPDC016588]
MTTVLLGLLAVAVFAIMIGTMRWWSAAFIAVIVTTTLVGRPIGLEVGAVSVQTYDVIILGVLFVGLLSAGGKPGLLLFAPFLVVLAIGMGFGWLQTPEMWQNGVYLMVGVAAWAIGHYFARTYTPGSGQDRVIVYVIAAVILLQVLVTVLQTAGVPIFSLEGRTAELEGGRANGTFSHPGTVGKVMILFAALLLPYTQAASKRIQRVAFVALLLALVPVGLSESRANFIGYVLALLLWFIIMPGRSARASRFVVPAVIIAVGLAFSQAIIDRFNADPEGGAREHFVEVALEAIRHSPWLGVGPGNYIPIVGQTDALTSQGWRVHNVFLLEITELGIPGAFLFFLPAIVLCIMSIRLMRRENIRGRWARAFLASAAGTIVTAVTGWGLMNGSIFMLWFLTMGFCFGMVRRKDLDSPSAVEVDSVPAKIRISG